MLAGGRINILSRFNVGEMVQAAINQTINGRCKIEDCFSLGSELPPSVLSCELVLEVVTRPNICARLSPGVGHRLSFIKQ